MRLINLSKILGKKKFSRFIEKADNDFTDFMSTSLTTEKLWEKFLFKFVAENKISQGGKINIFVSSRV